jgi:hypothetical protein
MQDTAMVICPFCGYKHTFLVENNGKDRQNTMYCEDDDFNGVGNSPCGSRFYYELSFIPKTKSFKLLASDHS